jgi:hypothetical protein
LAILSLSEIYGIAALKKGWGRKPSQKYTMDDQA